MYKAIVYPGTAIRMVFHSSGLPYVVNFDYIGIKCFKVCGHFQSIIFFRLDYASMG
jgi:hypothetical protein